MKNDEWLIYIIIQVSRKPSRGLKKVCIRTLNAELQDIRNETDNGTINFRSFFIIVANKRFNSVPEEFTNPAGFFSKEQISGTWGLG
jgi:hypothetical protein